METHSVGGFGRSFRIAFVGVTVCTGLPLMAMVLIPPGPFGLAGLLPMGIGLLITLFGLPFVGALCASKGRGVAEGALTGIAAAALTWVAVAVVVSPSVDDPATRFGGFLVILVLLTVLAAVPFMLGYFAGRWIGARSEWPSDPDQPDLGAPSGHADLGGHHR